LAIFRKKKLMFKKITRKNLEKFLEKHATDKRVLDLGSGGSSYHRFFPNRVSVDIDPERKPDIVADAHNLPFKDDEFEFVLCTEMLEHVQDPAKVISEIKRVLTKGGVVLLTTRFIFPLHDAPHDYWRFTEYGLKNLFKEWNIIEFCRETESFSTIGVLLQRMAFQCEFVINKPIKFILFVFAWLFNHLNFFIKKEYGVMTGLGTEKEVVSSIMSSGYYILAEKI